MIKVQKMRNVKERAHPNIQRRLVNVTRPDKWSHNIWYIPGRILADKNMDSASYLWY